MSRTRYIKKQSGTRFPPNESTFRGRSVILITHRWQENGVNKTANSENIFKTGYLSSMGDPLTFAAPAALKVNVDLQRPNFANIFSLFLQV